MAAEMSFGYEMGQGSEVDQLADECGSERKCPFVDHDRGLRVATSEEDEFDFDSAFSSESNQPLTDESTVEQQDGGGRNAMEKERLQSLEDEHEALSSNLIALTSHFAQVQLRLRQIVEAPHTERDGLLKNLEEFAFLGIPEIQQNPVKKNIPEIVADLDRSPETVESLREKQQELIEQLKSQLLDLERYAYESGAGMMPQSMLLEKQKVIIEEIKKKINLNLNELDLPQLTPEDLRHQVDTAVDELVNPLRMKEQLVAQLKTQIQDLERFIGFLQTNEKAEIKKRFLEQQQAANAQRTVSTADASQTGTANGRKFEATRRESFNSKAFGLMDKASTILQMFAVSQFSCGNDRNQENFQQRMTHRTRENCWGDIRARLEIDVQEVASLAMSLQSDWAIAESNDDEPRPVSGVKTYELTMMVRKQLAKTIQRLMQHGLRGIPESSGSLVPFISGCFSSGGGGGGGGSSAAKEDNRFHKADGRGKSTGGISRTATTTPPKRQSHSVAEDAEEDEARLENDLFAQLDEEEEDDARRYFNEDEGDMHAWELLLLYYNIKNGDRYNSTPARKLSESFNLDIVDGRPLSNKQSLLSAIGSIVALHSPYKRSFDSQFKAFVCAGLNAQKLTQWLYLIYQCKELVSSHYSSWSYVANTGFRDALKSLDRLTQYRFDLPVDLSIRQFKNIKDVFM